MCEGNFGDPDEREKEEQLKKIVILFAKEVIKKESKS